MGLTSSMNNGQMMNKNVYSRSVNPTPLRNSELSTNAHTKINMNSTFVTNFDQTKYNFKNS